MASSRSFHGYIVVMATNLERVGIDSRQDTKAWKFLCPASGTVPLGQKK